MTRTIVFYLGRDRADLWRAVGRARANGEVFVVNMAASISDDADIAPLPSNIGRAHASEASGDPAVGASRARAWSWLEDVALRRTTSVGASLFDILRDEEGRPLWWIADITLQERAFLAVRLIETLDAFAARVKPSGAVVAGTDADHPWQAAVIYAWARARRLDTTLRERARRDLTDAAPEPRRPRPHIPVPEIARSRWDKPVAVHTKAPPNVLADAGARIAEIAALPFLAPVIAAVLVLSTALSALTGARPASLLRRLGVAALRVVVAAVVLIVGVAIFVPLVLVIVAGGVIVILRSERPYGPTWLRDARGTLWIDPRSVLRELAGAVPIAEPARWSGVLAVHDVGNLRVRRDLTTGTRYAYNPYFEGILRSIRTAGLDVRMVAYGTLPRGRLSRAIARVRGVLRMADLNVIDVLSPAMWSAAARWYETWRETGDAIAARGGLGDVFTYRGVPLIDAMRSEITTLFGILHERMLYVAGFREVIRRIRPALVVAYNWEGVFRPLTDACVAEGVRLLGVQQALGPYGHALDHGTAGYAQPGDSGEGFRVPTRVALWGDVHQRALTGYGWPPDSLVRAGYARLDAFVRARPDRVRLRRRLRISHQDPLLVVFTAVLRVIGTGLVREANAVAAFDLLVRLAREDPRVFIVVKPWPGDALSLVQELVERRGSRQVRYLPPDSDLHNADLLAGSALLVGTFSSIAGEAAAAGCAPVIMDFPECRYYFGDEHVRHYEGVIPLARDLAELEAFVRRELAKPAQQRRADLEARRERLEALFGPADGRSAERVAALTLNLARAGAGPRAERVIVAPDRP